MSYLKELLQGSEVEPVTMDQVDRGLGHMYF